MLLHNIWIAWKSLRRSPVLSVLIIACIGIGIAFATTFATVRHAFTKHPLPAKESVLRYVRLDNWDPREPYPGGGPDALPPQISYRDAMELRRSAIPVRQTASFRSRLTVFPEPGVARPTKENVRLAHADFFPMFDVPFRYGHGWDRQADEKLDQVVVLSEDMNNRLFGGRDSVGRSVRIEDREFRVVGVLSGWRPSIRMYDMTGSTVSDPEPVYMPFGFHMPMRLRSAGNSDGWGPGGGTSFEASLNSEQTFIQYWVELPTEADASAYRSFIESYITEQKTRGRFGRPLNYRLSSIRELMDDFKVAPPETLALLVVGLLFLIVASVNLIGLLLGKFLARASEVGVRRALGASRKDVFLQHLVECEVVSLLGGGLGVLLTLGSLAGLNAFMRDMVDRGDLFTLDAQMLVLALGLSIAAGLISGLYPAWRICRLAPANHLKA